MANKVDGARFAKVANLLSIQIGNVYHIPSDSPHPVNTVALSLILED